MSEYIEGRIREHFMARAAGCRGMPNLYVMNPIDFEELVQRTGARVERHSGEPAYVVLYFANGKARVYTDSDVERDRFRWRGIDHRKHDDLYDTFCEHDRQAGRCVDCGDVLAPPADELSASEALFGFAGWLTTRQQQTVMSASDNASPIADLVAAFIAENELAPPREGWHLKLNHPREGHPLEGAG